MAADLQQVATMFVEYYYNQFDQDRAGLATLYRDGSMLTFESASFKGTPSIIEKLQGLPFQQIKHQVSTMDPQPGVAPDHIMVLVTGQLLVDEEQRPMSYTQSFYLVPESVNGQTQYYVHNDIFKLVYG
ncbi:nuclear transport factor 2 [Annulohypoxylon maeteangense]|uniref:nuclear transport factor 2 n=1 Tax=Annulohypoxylon maeteangense TaxID=1927788 RepID=UPI002007B13B|nr:nuclear transport factor 2 [Annulohypoxylon maeteangense]KAI0888065.1 nuclear transport factor 2 [Annulohypoxylon maeteangense]